MQLSANVLSQAEAFLPLQTPGRGPSVFFDVAASKNANGRDEPGHHEQSSQLNSKRSPQLILRLVDQRALLDPGHHVAQLGADVLDRVGGELGTRP
jgi:hypothetical protein